MDQVVDYVLDGILALGLIQLVVDNTFSAEGHDAKAYCGIANCESIYQIPDEI